MKKVDIKSLLGTENFQYAIDNFAGIVRSVEYFENNFEHIIEHPSDLFFLAATGYYVSLGSLIRNKQGMDYTKVFEIWEVALEKNKDYLKQNETLQHNISILKKWEKDLDYEMNYVLNIRDKYFAHIDFVNKDFLLKSFLNKDQTKQNDLVKFFQSMI